MIRVVAATLGVTLFGTPALADNPSLADCLPTPVFAESFTARDISPHWTIVTHPAMANGNRELQAYQADALTAGPEGLRISATRHGAGFASGRVASKAAFRYGCFDIVAQMPAGRGLWPALWLRTPYGQAIDGEIDIMEGFGSHPGVFQATLHHWAAGVHHGFDCTRIGDLRSTAFGMSSVCGWQPRLWHADFTASTHHYGVVWTPRAISWLIDGVPFYTVRDGIPDRAMAIQLNLAVGGVFDGDPDAATAFPAVMTVHSVSVRGLRP